MIRTLLTITLLVSAAVGAQILLTDSDLWEAAQSHAYGLIGFVVLDLLVAALTLARPRLGSLSAMAWALVKFFIMLGDILTARSVGFEDYAQFMNYLFSLWNFDTLLILQLLVALVAYGAFRTTKQTKTTD